MASRLFAQLFNWFFVNKTQQFQLFFSIFFHKFSSSTLIASFPLSRREWQLESIWKIVRCCYSTLLESSGSDGGAWRNGFPQKSEKVDGLGWTDGDTKQNQTKTNYTRELRGRKAYFTEQLLLGVGSSLDLVWAIVNHVGNSLFLFRSSVSLLHSSWHTQLRMWSGWGLTCRVLSILLKAMIATIIKSNWISWQKRSNQIYLFVKVYFFILIRSLYLSNRGWVVW